MAVTFRKPVDDNVPWDQRLANYASNKDAGKSEYQRALEVYRGKSALGDTEGANAAKKWSDQVNTAIGGIGDNIVSNRADQINKTTDTVGQKVNATPFEFKQTNAPFQYNAQSDPSYQAALREAQRNTQTAAGNTASLMNSRGILDSTITADRTGQQAQQEYGHVSDTILPQLMQQAYGRYQDQNNNDYRNQLANYQAGQDQVKNLTGYAGTLNGLNQQDFNNNLATNQDTRAQQAQDANFTGYYNNSNTSAIQKQIADNKAAYDSASPAEKQRLHVENLALAKSIGGTDTTGNGDYTFSQGQRTLQGQQMDYQKVRDSIADEQYKQKFDEDVRRYGLDHALQQAVQLGQLKISQQNANTSSASAANSVSSANFNKLMDVFKATGKAPAGLESYGIQPGSSLADVKDNTQIKSEVDGLYTGLSSGKINAGSAIDEINQKMKIGLYTPAEGAQLLAVAQQFSLGNKSSMPQLSDTQAQQIEQSGGKNYQAMNAAQIEKEWNADPSGKAAGTALYDWSAWVRDPRGKLAGVSYPAYQQAFGASIS
jgi:hypothetical protein